MFNALDSFDRVGQQGVLQVDLDLVFEPWPHLPAFFFDAGPFELPAEALPLPR